MQSAQFTSARTLLTAAQAGLLDAQLSAWKAEAPPSPWPQNAANIEKETCLEPKAFAKLLSDFIDLLPGANAWKEACYKNQFKGQRLPTAQIPEALGRLLELEKLIDYSADATGYSRSQIEKLLVESDGKDMENVDSELLEIFKVTPIGRYIIWATFDEKDHASDPFLPFSADASDCCTRLGLNDPKGSTCILLAYQSAPYRRTAPRLRMNRPSVADAGGFSLYRPDADPAKPYGMTHPTFPNPKGFSGHPEVVHKEITGQGLAFKLRLVR